ncbi:TadE/TadG family type IV pilus assembly protein [Brevibacillus choshinensis]|uniref:TadE/TadG family type IV pilus assembly protein n=1 Tax=Brevibacillus choshinensis TaxID=54911 RepID=UPI002E1ACEDC|nr:pilus assembly protein TadG-related protein [Brevibacillus choshinensis]
MRQSIVLLRNERGNMTILVLTVFFFMLLVIFTVLFNFSSVFVDKEVAANSAELASLAATDVIYDEVEEAIHSYDHSIVNWIDPVYIWPLVEEEMKSIEAANPDWSSSEVQFEAIDRVLLVAIPVYPDLLTHVVIGLDQASSDIPGVVTDILASNKSTLSGSSIKLFNGEDRIEVRTSVRYESKTFGMDFMPKHAEQIYQTGKSRTIGFVKVTGWKQLPHVFSDGEDW